MQPLIKQQDATISLVKSHRGRGMLVLRHSVYKCFLLSWVRLVSVPVWAVHGTHFNASASYLACSWTLLSSFEQLAQAQLGLHLNSEVLFSLGNQVQMLFQSSIHIIWFEFKVGNPETPVYRQAPVRLNGPKPSARLITDRMITLFTAWHSTKTDGRGTWRGIPGSAVGEGALHMISWHYFDPYFDLFCSVL